MANHVKPVTANRTITRIEYDGGACRCDKIRSPWGGRTTHTTGQCRHLPEPRDEKGQRR